MNPELTPKQLTALQSSINAAKTAYNNGDYAGVTQNLTAYYTLQAQAGRGYATEALSVINVSGFDGEVATAMLQAAGGVTPGTKQYANLMLSLANSDNTIVQANNGSAWPSIVDIDNYHYTDFVNAGVNPGAWSGASFAYYNVPWNDNAAELNGQDQTGNLYQQNLTQAQANSSAYAVWTQGAVYTNVLGESALPGYFNTMIGAPAVQANATPSFQAIKDAFQLGWAIYSSPTGQVTAQLNGVTLTPTDGANGTVNVAVSPTDSSDSIPTITITAAPMTLWEKIQFDVDNFVDTLSGQVQAGATAVSNYFNSVISTLETAGSSGTGATLTDDAAEIAAGKDVTCRGPQSSTTDPYDVRLVKKPVRPAHSLSMISLPGFFIGKLTVWRHPAA